MGSNGQWGGAATAPRRAGACRRQWQAVAAVHARRGAYPFYRQWMRGRVVCGSSTMCRGSRFGVWAGGRRRRRDQTVTAALQDCAGWLGERSSGLGRVSSAREASWHVQGANRGRNRAKPELFTISGSAGVRMALGRRERER